MEEAMKKILILSCTLALAALSGNVLAAEGNQGFIRLEAGKSHVSMDDDDFGSSSDNDTAWAVRGGYWFTKNFGAEVMYTTLYDKRSGDFSLEFSGWGLGAVAKKNFGAHDSGFFVGGRVGLMHLEGKAGNTLGATAKESSDKPYAGVGIGYDFNEMFGLSLNYDYNRADFKRLSVDANTVTLGGEMRF
jgi:hypothetical protein